MRKRWDYTGLHLTPLPRHLNTGQLMVLIVLIGSVIGLAAMAGASAYYKNSLQTRIHSIAEALGSSQVARLQTTASDEEVAIEYAYVKDKLSRIKSSNEDARFVYLMSRGEDGKVYFLADSEPEDSDSYSPRGEPYPEASPELKAMFDTGRLLVEGPSGDSYGTWLSALAPVVDEKDYRISAVVGIDVPATTFGLLLGLSGGIPLLLSVVAATLLYIRRQIGRRQREHVQFRAEMISIASHELRTPLTGIRWSVESMLGGKVSAEKQQRSLEIMYDSTIRLEESIEDILQLASLESGKARRLFLKEVDLRDVMDDIIAMQRLAAERRNVDLTYASSWPKHLMVVCDSQRMKRVFHNIISNAVKYSRPDTTVTIGYHPPDHSAEPGHGGHIFSIADHGIGIPAAEQAQVWDGFYRATNTETHDIHGTGMGLYLSRTIAEQHGGRIWFESVEGEGTTVYIELPDVPADGPVPPMQTRG